MSFNPHISLIDLGKQFPFEIDDKIKDEICFGETLVVSCGHYDGDMETESIDSEWSCYESTESENSEEVKDATVYEVKDHVSEEVTQEQVAEEDHDFHFYFFPDCNKPLRPQDSKASILIEEGMPKVNPAVQENTFCTCDIDESGKCTCYVKLPCKCGAKVVDECTCAKLQDICICEDGKPQVTCSCTGSKVCVCYPGDKLNASCVCEKLIKPCICDPGNFPTPVCVCKRKPRCEVDVEKSIENEEEDLGEELVKKIDAIDETDEPCVCQVKEQKSRCLCLRNETCICKDDICICDIRKPCICKTTESQDHICVNDDSKSVCSCIVKKECTCVTTSPGDCKCFPNKVCTCGDPDNCKCFAVCDCTKPCICDIQSNDVESEVCTCLTKPMRMTDGVCTSTVKKEKDRTLKKERAGKHGYRWCHAVNPKHTYFDFGYGRHDKISYKEPELEKVKILGLTETKQEEVCALHGVKAPPYEKKTRKPSIDCCSSVGGISICVETLGEDKDKFLVQVVSNSSKEGAKTGSKLVSILDTNLHTMEESRIEHITKRDFTKERKNYIAICENGYYNKVTRICGERYVVRRFYHTFEAARNFLLEGANVILLRYFGLRRYRGNIKTETVLIDGTICESIYVCLGVSKAIVNGTPLFVVKVERHIIEPSGLIHQTLTVLTLRGYIVSHEWADNNYLLHLNPLLRVVPEKDQIEPHAPLREKWRDDLQLLSDYLDFKSVRSSEGGRYMAESGALTGTVRDYLQALLLLRPHDAIHFTRHYFGSALSALDLPHNEYFDPSSKHVRYYFFEE